MNDYSNIAEYSVQKSRGVLFNICKIAVPIVSTVLSLLISNLLLGAYGLIVGMLSLIVLLAFSIGYSCFYFRRIDYDYRIIGNELFFSVVYNRKKRKELCSVDISTLEKIAPYAGRYIDELEKESFDKVRDLSSSLSDPYVFYAVEKDEESGNKTMYIFNATEKMLKLIKLYNRRAIITPPNE